MDDPYADVKRYCPRMWADIIEELPQEEWPQAADVVRDSYTYALSRARTHTIDAFALIVAPFSRIAHRLLRRMP